MTDHEAFNDNGDLFIEVACSICGGVSEPWPRGIEPVCFKCFYDELSSLCALCGGRPESICGRCGDRICGSAWCLRVHEHHNPSPRGDEFRPAPGP
jgi:hypothetical protein